MRAIFAEFTVFPWKLTKLKNKFIAKFSSSQGLNHVVIEPQLYVRIIRPVSQFIDGTAEEEDLSCIFPIHA